MLVLVSPESPSIFWTGWPKTPPAALMSLIAALTPANSGGPRNASDPVCGSRVPKISGPAAALLEAGAELEAADDEDPPPELPPQAASARLATPRTTADRSTVVRVMDLFSL